MGSNLTARDRWRGYGGNTQRVEIGIRPVSAGVTWRKPHSKRLLLPHALLAYDFEQITETVYCL